MPALRPDLYISADIETDGPIPGEFSMLSFGLCVAGLFDGERFMRPSKEEQQTLYIELQPISDRFEVEALRVNGLDREALAHRGERPEDAMRTADHWVRSLLPAARPVLVAYPLAFDWAFLYWYFIRFTGDSPFGFSSCLDIRTLYQARALTPFDASSQRSMPPWLLPSAEHTHNAGADAREQAELFSNIFEWALAGGGEETHPIEVLSPNWMSTMVNPDLPAPGVLGSKERRRLRRGRG